MYKNLLVIFYLCQTQLLMAMNYTWPCFDEPFVSVKTEKNFCSPENARKDPCSEENYCHYNVIPERNLPHQSGKIFVKISAQKAQKSEKATLKMANQYFKNLKKRFDEVKITQPFAALPQMANVWLIQISPDSQVPKLIHELEKLMFVAYAERVPNYQLYYTPNDPELPQQWHLPQVNAQQAWDISKGSTTTILAIVDDAVLLNHTDLIDNIYTNPNEIPNNNIDDDNNGYIDDVNGWDAADQDNNPNPPASATDTYFTHGTHCAGIAAASTDNNTGIASLGFNTRILPIKCKANNSPFPPAIESPYEGVAYAIAANANIISMSWGGSLYSQTYQDMFTLAHNAGIILIAAAGNDNTTDPRYPSCYNHIISVGATNEGNQKADFSNYGTCIDIMAPGVNIYSSLAGSLTSYGFNNGTSMACPLVAGLAALLVGFDNDLTPDDVENCLLTTAINIDAINNPDYSGKLGSGLIDAYLATACLITTPIVNFEANPISTCNNTPIQFTDKTIHNPNWWQWTFTNGLPATDTTQNPQVIWNTDGDFAVQLISCNDLGCDTLEKIIHIGPPTASMYGGTTINLGNNAVISVDLTGPKPWNLTYTDGTTNFDLTNIETNPLILNVSPVATTTYSLVSVSTANCPTGTVSGSATVIVEGGCALPTAFARTYGGNFADYGHAIYPTADCGFVTVGTTYSFGAGNYDALIVKTDNFGTMEWATAYGDVKEDILTGVIPMPNDDGYFAWGVNTAYNPDGWADNLILRTNANGDMLWKRVFGQDISDYFGEIIPLPNGHFLGAGIYSVYSLFTTELDENGNTLWMQTYDMQNNEYVRRLLALPDGSYLVCGGFQTTGNTYDIYLLNVDSQGKVNWSRGYGNTENEHLNDIIPATNGGFILAGSTDSDGAGKTDGLLIKIKETNGDVVWAKTYGGIDSEAFTRIRKTCDGNYFVSGNSQSYNNGLPDVFFATVDEDGNLLTAKIYGKEGSEETYDLAATGDCGMALLVRQTNLGTDDTDLLLLKLNDSITPECLYTEVSPNVETISINKTNLSASASPAAFANRTDKIVQNNAPLTPTDSLCTACQKPSAEFAIVQNQFTFHFLNQSYQAETYQWWFGDGATDTIENPVYEYKTSGTYDVTLVASNGCGSDTITKSIIVDDIDYCKYVLQPGTVKGKDAYIFSRQDQLNVNNSQAAFNYAMTWTWSGIPGTMRSLIEFDLGLVCLDDNLKAAYLSLYYPELAQNTKHAGENEAWLQRVIDPWNEYTVTWNNQPPTTTTNQYSIAKLNGTQDLLDMDVLPLVTDIVNNPDDGYGFLFRLQTEETYRSWSFASSDHPSPAKRPKLELHLTKAEGKVDKKNVAICQGQTIDIGASGGMHYRWWPTDGLTCTDCPNPTASPDSTTTYYVAIFNCEYCAHLDSVRVFVNKVDIETGDAIAICQGQSAQLWASIESADYLWSPATGLNDPTIPNPIATPDTTTQYVVTATFPNNCSASDTITVYVEAPPAINLPPDTNFCSLPFSMLLGNPGVSNYYYEWSPATGLSNPNIANPTATVNQTTVYTLKVTNQQGCSDSKSITLTYQPQTYDLGPDTSLCGLKNFTIVTPGLYEQYLWSDGSTEPNLVVAQTGFYAVTVTDKQGCTASDTLFVELKDSPLNASFTTPDALCPGEELQINFSGYAPPGSIFSWQTSWGQTLEGEGPFLLTIPDEEWANSSGQITVTLILTQADCTTFFEKNITLSSLTVQTIADTTIIPPAQVLLTTTTVNTPLADTPVFTWTANGEPLICDPNCQAPIVQPTETTTYIVTATNANGCISADTVLVSVEQAIKIMFPSAFSPNNDGLSDVFAPKINHPEIKLTWQVYNRWGQLVFTSTPNEPIQGWNGQLPNGNQAPAGVYVYYANYFNNINGSEQILKGNLTLLR